MPGRNITDGEKTISFRRQEEIFDPVLFQKEITIVGTGNIGSWAALALAKLGIKSITLYDDDIVESHNLSSQCFSIEDIDKNKVDCLEKQLKGVNNSIDVFRHAKKFNGEELIDDVLIVAVDSMKERQRIYNNIKHGIIYPKVIIDARLGGPQLEIYTCRSLEEWNETFSDNPSQDPCGARYICYISMIVGALIANQIKRVLKDESIKRSILFHLDTLQLI
ncbi:MAG: ThiF family adenylyltransferase [Methanogenium sp.]|jgi:hypothetical protein